MPPEHLIGRANTIRSIATRMVNGAHTAVPGPRKEGKTSACRAALAQLASRRGVLAIELDLYGVEDEDGFLNAVSDATAAATTGHFGPAISAASRLVPRLARLGVQDLAAEAGVDNLLDGIPSGRGRHEATLRLPERAARLQNGQAALLIDEAQRMTALSDRFRRLVHRTFRDSRSVTLLLTGGDGTSLGDLLDEPLGPISDLILHRELLPPISDAEWRAGLRRLFNLGGCQVQDAALQFIIEEGKGIGVTAVHSTIAIAHHVHLQARMDGLCEISAGTAFLGFETAAPDLKRLSEDG
jgi:hypothetical protein